MGTKKEDKTIYEELENKYQLTKDLHTHTMLSHGRNDAYENVERAVELGLESIAITDHGPGNIPYGINQKVYKQFKDNDLPRIIKQFPQIEILWGVEANIMFEDVPNTDKNAKSKYSQKGIVDIKEPEYENYDFLIAGYHYGVISGWTFRNWFADKGLTTKKFVEKQRKRNTDMILDVIENVPIKILTHPGDKAPVDIVKIAKACAEKGIYMEINNRHKHLNTEELKEIKDIDVKFVINSDAHASKDVGTFSDALKRALDAGIEIDRIENIKEREK